MNSGCFKKEFKDILISIQLVDFKGVVRSLPANKIDFNYRSIELLEFNFFKCDFWK